MNNSKKILKNTISLYIRLFVNLILTFYTTRLVLQSLGASDFGINNLISSVITFCSFFVNTISLSVQRYFSIEIGKSDIRKVEIYYNASVRIALIVGLFFIILGEILSFLLFDHFLNIPPDRIFAAKVIYQTVLLSFFFNIIRIPFIALINAFEDINIVAVIGIIESIGKLLIAIIIVYSIYDRLIFYSTLLLVLTISISLIFLIYTRKKYIQIKLTKQFISKEIYTDLGKFAGFSAIMNLSVVGKEQGVVLLLNLFGGTLINAAYGISSMVQGQIRSITSMMFNAVVPRITSDFGSGRVGESNKLMFMSSKFAFFAFSIICVPIFLFLPLLLKLWLKSYPDYTVEFCRIQLIVIVIDTLIYPLNISISAHGKIKGISISMFFLNIITLILSFVFLKIGFNFVSVLYFSIINIVILGIIRLYYSQKLIFLNAKIWVKEVFLKSIIPLMITIVFILCISFILPNSVFWQSIMLVTCFIVGILSVWFFGLNRNEKSMFVHLILNKLKRSKN